MKRIPLTQGKYALVDDEDYEFLMQWKWTLTGSRRYAHKRNHIKRGRTHILMHRLILGNPRKNKQVDHIDGNGLNNQKKNLRAVTKTQNQWNRKKNKNGTSKYKGVRVIYGKFQARIQTDGVHINLGLYDTEIAARNAYIRAAKKYHGEFAKW